MIIFDVDTKKLEIPIGLGNLEVNIVSGGTGAGVSSLNGQTGALTLKTINGNNILGEGNIATSGSPEELITSAVTEANAYTDEKIGALVIPTKTSQLDNDSGFIGSEGLADYSTTAQTQSAISEAIAAETARTESTYLKEASLDNYATKEWVEGKGYVTSAETANFVTSAQTKEQIEGYHYTTSADTSQAISEALTGYYTSGQTDNKISSALTDYYTSGQTNNAISAATQNMVTSTAINNIWVGLQSEYDNIPVKDIQTLYFIRS